jgi:hypothetical protein
MRSAGSGFVTVHAQEEMPAFGQVQRQRDAVAVAELRLLLPQVDRAPASR